MILVKKVVLALCFFLVGLTGVLGQKTSISTAKPWAYWWWMGSAVTEEGIRQNLKDYASAGLGGLHIIPIYGVKGNEQNNIPFMSPLWKERLAFTIAEARKLGMGIDLTMGTGWPFGGKEVSLEDAAKKFQVKLINGQYQLEILPTMQKVKRAAPGGEGLVLDHFNTKALRHYLAPFQATFSGTQYPLRALYNDSYEVYGANWTNNFLEEFQQRRGYDLAKYLDVLAKTETNSSTEQRIWGDYNATIADLCRDAFTATWNDACKKMGKITRNEAHGSPGNMLDLYALSDIPETEYFGTKAFGIPFFRRDPDFEVSRFGTPDPLVIKFATSSANTTGKKLVSSETATWLANHFKVSLSQVKPIVDESFTSGINHIFYHGIPYSPPHDTYPGWLFYASTNFNQQSHFWNEFRWLNSYVTRCQELLQTASADNEVLLYFPIHDIWHDAGGKEHVHLLSVHANAQELLFSNSFGKLAKLLQQNGVGFDYISDLQITKAHVNTKGQIISEGGLAYKTIIIPQTAYLPFETLQALQRLQQKGAKIIFAEGLPQHIAGFLDWEKKELALKAFTQDKATIPLEKLPEVLAKNGVRNEVLPQLGISFIRKTNANGTLYFISNFDQKFQHGNITLKTNAQAVELFDAVNNRKGFVPFKRIDANTISINIKLLAGQSLFIQTFKQAHQGAKWIDSNLPAQQTLVIDGPWQVDFLEGQPFRPASYSTQKLESWTSRGDSTNGYFTGTARYSNTFKWTKKAQTQPIWLNLGNVRESATVKINGKIIGTAWCLPFRLAVPSEILKTENTIEIDVKNLSANRMRYIDKQSHNWKKFHDINIVDIQYKALEPAQWQPEPSGLLSPVVLEIE